MVDGSYNPHQNCQPIGNVLIIQESNKLCPDDTWAGGWLQFDFVKPTEVLFAKLLDVDEGKFLASLFKMLRKMKLIKKIANSFFFQGSLPR